jgi:hypothetical protein
MKTGICLSLCFTWLVAGDGIGAEITNLVAGVLPGTVRNDFGGWVGMQIRTKTDAITVTALGRWILEGNSQPHTLRIVTQAGAELGRTMVSPAGFKAGQFQYAELKDPVALAPGNIYYVVSKENLQGDAWLDFDTRLRLRAAPLEVTAAVYEIRGGWVPIGTNGNSYVPMDLLWQGTPKVPLGSEAVTLKWDYSPKDEERVDAWLVYYWSVQPNKQMTQTNILRVPGKANRTARITGLPRGVPVWFAASAWSEYEESVWSNIVEWRADPGTNSP